MKFESIENQSPEAESEQRQERERGFKLDFYVTDHSAKHRETGSPEQLRELYADVKRDGITSVRYDWDWWNCEPKQGEFNEEGLGRYQSAKEIMAEVGLDAPTIILSNPPKWAVELYKKDKEQFFDEFRKYAEEVKAYLVQSGGEKIGRVQILNELNNTIYTPIHTEDLPQLCEITREVFRDYNPEIKLMATLIAANMTGFMGQGGVPIEKYLPEFEKIKDSFDDIAVDYYAGMWHLQAGDNPKLDMPEVVRRAMGDPKELFKEMTAQIEWVKSIFERVASWGKEYELGEVGSPTRWPWERAGDEPGKPQRYFYDAFFREFKKMLVDFRERGIPLPTRVGFYEAIDEPLISPADYVKHHMTPTPEYALGMRERSGKRKMILRGSPHAEPEGPAVQRSQLSKIISYLRAPVENKQ